jgi:D-glycero-D-manno-heptose 1,7-bisphosphate phosphatase
MKNKAIFLDRDGVINPLVYNSATGEYEPPRGSADFAIYPYVEKSLRLLRDAGYKIVLVSNQPDCAKGKATMGELEFVAKALEDWSSEHGGLIDSFNYCYHHPDGIIPEYTCACKCRKPGTLFLENAAEALNIDPERSFFVGDRENDVECGLRFGCKTVKIHNLHSETKDAKIAADYCAHNLLQAALMICGEV